MSAPMYDLLSASAPVYDLLRGVTISRHILVGCVEITILSSGNNMYGYYTAVHLKIQNSFGDTLREMDVVANHSGRSISISAILEKPVLLSPSDVYSISSSSPHQWQHIYHQSGQSNVSLTYGNLNISGVMSDDAALSLAFWCSSDLF